MELWIIGADDEEEHAEAIAVPLRDAGYYVHHMGTMHVGTPILGSIDSAIARGVPIVLAATRAAMGDRRCQLAVNAARAAARNVFVVRMHPQAALGPMEADRLVADYSENPGLALQRLVDSVQKAFPLDRPEPNSDRWQVQLDLERLDFFDQEIESADLRLETVAQVGLPLDSEDREALIGRLQSLGLMRRTQLTLAGLLLFGTDPQRLLPSAVVQCFAYDGVDTTDPVVARGRFAGNLLEQISVSLDFVRQYAQQHEVLQSNTGRASVSHAYSDLIVKEVIANALVHRNYTEYGQRVHVNLFRDRLCISSPGEWGQKGYLGPKPVELGTLPRLSDARNPRLAAALSELRFIEGQGSGLPKIVVEALSVRARSPVARQLGGVVEVTIFPAFAHDPVRDALVAEIKRQWESAWFSSNQGGEGSSTQQYVDRRLRSETGHWSAGSVDARELLENDSPILAIVDGAGSGKTVFLRHLAYRSIDFGFSPFFVSASQYSGGNAADWIASIAKSETVSADAILGLIASQKALLLIDGMDETNGDLRSELVSRLAPLTGNSQLRIILSSRSSRSLQDLKRLNANYYSFLEPTYEELIRLAGMPNLFRLGLEFNWWHEIAWFAVPVVGRAAPNILIDGPWTTLDTAVSLAMQREVVRTGTAVPLHSFAAVYQELAAKAFIKAPRSHLYEIDDLRKAAMVAVSSQVSEPGSRSLVGILVEHFASGHDLFISQDGSQFHFSKRVVAEYFAADWIVRNRNDNRLVQTIVSLVERGQEGVASLAVAAANARTSRTKQGLLDEIKRSARRREYTAKSRIHFFVENEIKSNRILRQQNLYT